MTNTRHRILVVDDLSDWRATLKGVLVDEGYDVEVANSSARALKLLEAGHFDLAVLDIRLDDSDEDNTEGLDLAAEIRQHWPVIKVVMITGYGTPDTMRRAMEPDAQGRRLVANYIQKTETEELVKIVREALA